MANIQALFTPESHRKAWVVFSLFHLPSRRLCDSVVKSFSCGYNRARERPLAAAHIPLRRLPCSPRTRGPDLPAVRSRKSNDRSPDVPADGAVGSGVLGIPLFGFSRHTRHARLPLLFSSSRRDFHRPRPPKLGCALRLSHRRRNRQSTRRPGPPPNRRRHSTPPRCGTPLRLQPATSCHRQRSRITERDSRLCL